MPSVIVDGKEIEISPTDRLNGIEIARRAGVEIPHYCWHPGLSVVASCRMCLCETGTRNAETGAITMMPKLVPACQTPARDNTVFVTDSEKIRQARAYVEEALLIDHPIDCPICDKAGECLLQDYYFLHGQKERRADLRPFTSRKRPMGDTVTLFVDRCVMCTRCVRFTREITGTSELMVANRGSHEEIDVLPGFPLDNKLSGNVVDICPVGALGDKDFLYSQRVWFMKRHAGVCTGCSTGCSVHVEENQDHVYRLKPRENSFINQWWMCDEGRYGYHHLHAENRLVGARHRDAQGVLANVEWNEMRPELDAALRKAGRLAAVLSPHLTVEEAYLLAKYVRSIDANAVLALGPVPVDGEDERFLNGFTIHAEKCPNRRGVEAVLKHFAGNVTTFDDFTVSLASSDVKAVWISGGYKTDWNTAETAAAFAGLDVLVVQDMFSSPLMEQATHQLPGAGFAERDGSYVNFQDRLQSVRWAIRPPAGAWVDGQIFWQMLGKPGLFNSRAVLSDVAAEILFFEAAGADVPETGVDLRAKLLAESGTK
ncbi:MAG: ferredoxin [Planctomycetia bacterium]|nr:ferredoxin [Planctomycetia bacterium]